MHEQFAIQVPRVEDLWCVNPTETSYMRVFGAPDRAAAYAWTPLSSIAPLLPNALIRAEDPRFFDHHGVDWWGIGQVLRKALRTGRLKSGASTITQQLARNLYLTPRRSLGRKLREILLARRLSRTLTKTRVLELYLNLVEWGPGVWGAAAASDYYFAKAPGDLDLFEATFLVTLLPAPKSGLAGRRARRSRRVQLSVCHQLLLAGLASADACALCSARVRELHRLVAEGMPLRTALAQSAHVSAAGESEFLRDIVADLRLERIPPDEMLTARCRDRQQQRAAFERLVARFGEEPVREFFATGCYAGFMNHPAAPRPREERQ
jgi:membrane carboxypeptidase/penicillin-binding protein